MGKTNCYNCNKEFGIISLKFSNTDLWNILSHPKVATMSPNDRICIVCKQLFEDEAKVNKAFAIPSETKEEIANNEAKKRSSEYKTHWNKNGVIQFKNERIAILQRMWGSQVEFIVAYDDLTKEGYRLMAIDEGKEGGQASGGFTGGVNAYFYFQKIELVR